MKSPFTRTLIAASMFALAGAAVAQTTPATPSTTAPTANDQKAQGARTGSTATPGMGTAGGTTQDSGAATRNVPATPGTTATTSNDQSAQGARTGSTAAQGMGTAGGMSKDSGATRSDPSRTSVQTPEQAARKGEPMPAGGAMGGGRMSHGTLKSMDADKDGMVSKTEFMQYHEAMFDRMPKDGSGNVSLSSRTSSRGN